MTAINGGYRNLNPATAGTQVVLIARPLRIDAECFIVEDLDAEEAAKCARMPQSWRYVDREGAEVQGLRRDALNAELAKLDAEIVNINGLLEDRQRRRAEVLERRAVIDRKTEVVEAKAAEEAQKPIVLEDKTFNELRALCAENGIVVPANERSAAKLIAALKPILNPKESVDGT